MADAKRPVLRRLRRLALFAVIVGAAGWFAPVATLVLLACGLLDVLRHRKVTVELIEQYFTSKGLVTWLLSPVNLAADLVSWGAPGRGIIALGALPEAHRREIATVVAAFLAHGEAIRAHIAAQHADAPRAMLTFKWFDVAGDTGLDIPAFQRRYRFVKTIAVSTFQPHARTSWHFGPHRLTFRVLRNLDPITSAEAWVAVDDQVRRWADDPLLVFEDTSFHQSVNDLDAVRYCLFLDVVRPNHVQPLFDAAIALLGLAVGPFKAMFYRNWAFIR